MNDQSIKDEALLLFELERKEDFVVASSSVKGDLCHTCKKEVAKYKCPKCESISCSLICVNQHKTEKKCNGKRPFFTKVSINEFTDSTFRRDIRYLDRIAQIAERSARVTSRRFAERIASSHSSGKKHLALAVFRRKCEERNIRLKLCPPELSLRNCNTTQLTRKTKRLSWRVQWEFPHCKKKYVDTGVSEESKLKDLLKRFIQPTKQILQIEGISSTDECAVLLKDHSSNKSRWFLLNQDLKLIENLKNKTIVEFPVFHAIPLGMLHQPPFELIVHYDTEALGQAESSNTASTKILDVVDDDDQDIVIEHSQQNHESEQLKIN